MTDTIYMALYCPSIHESGYITLSLHKTIEGANTAIEEHKAIARIEWLEWTNDMYKRQEGIGILRNESYADFEERFPFGEYEGWRVDETQLLD